MEFTNYIRKPFVVQAVEVTEENIAEFESMIGKLRKKEDGTPYIQVNRRLVPNVFRVYPGFWVTKMGDNIHCYSKKLFNEQFIEASYEVQAWVDHIQAGGVVPQDDSDGSEVEVVIVDDFNQPEPVHNSILG